MCKNGWATHLLRTGLSPRRVSSCWREEICVIWPRFWEVWDVIPASAVALKQKPSITPTRNHAAELASVRRRNLPLDRECVRSMLQQARAGAVELICSCCGRDPRGNIPATWMAQLIHLVLFYSPVGLCGFICFVAVQLCPLSILCWT